MEEIKKLKIMTKLDKMCEELGKLSNELPNELYSKVDEICNELTSLEFKIDELIDEDDYDSYSEERARELEVWK